MIQWVDIVVDLRLVIAVRSFGMAVLQRGLLLALARSLMQRLLEVNA